MLMRRRPLAHAAMVGGAAYYAGKRRQDTVYREDEQEARLQQLEAQQYPSAPAAPAGGAPPIGQLKELAQRRRPGLVHGGRDSERHRCGASR